jgi:cytochrome c oxidase subunit 2
VNYIAFRADAAGNYSGQCAEFCGASHANMGLRVLVDSDAGFAAWVKAQQGLPVAPPKGSPAEQGKAIYSRSACLGCHTIQGVSPGIIGPNLTHVGSRSTIAGGLFPNDSAHLASWIADAPALKPGATMTRMKPPLTDADIAALVAYLASLK